MTVNLEVVYLTSRNPELQVYLQLGPTNPVITDGYGGWQTQDRPLRVSLTRWQGRKPFAMSLDGYITDFVADKSVERRIRNLEKMALVAPGSSPPRPPTVRVHGDAIPVPYNGIPWVIVSLDWLDTIRSTDHGDRVRQHVTISLLQMITADLLNENNILPGHNVQPKYRLYTIHRGDTLQSIARKLLGKASRWQEIARLNNIHDPRNLTVGRKIRVPRK